MNLRKFLLLVSSFFTILPVRSETQKKNENPEVIAKTLESTKNPTSTTTKEGSSTESHENCVHISKKDEKRLSNILIRRVNIFLDYVYNNNVTVPSNLRIFCDKNQNQILY
jgi:lipopolysaccharide export LptBFGC system permease protein LptF